MGLNKLIPRLLQNPSRLFAIDALGAMLTSTIIGVAMPALPQWFVIPGNISSLLAVIAAVFALYSFGCSMLLLRSYQPFILVIAIANALYCALTALVLIGFWQQISVITSIYFMLEICVITALVYIELRVWLLLRKMDLPK